MGRIANTGLEHYAHLIEHTGGALTAVNDWMEVDAHSDTYTFAATVTGGANFTLALECSFNNTTWFTIDTSKTINSNGEYVYFISNKAAAKIRMRIASISSGTPNVLPHIAVTYEG